MLDGAMRFARRGQPVIVTPFTLAGAMAPVTMAGAVVLSIAEALAAIALLQVVRPGVACMIGTFTSNVDMKSGAPAFGTPEYMRATQMTGQMARFYGLPLRASNACASNAPDGQAMWESLNSLWSAVQSGVNLVYHAAGWLEGGLIASYEKFVMDCEVLQQFQRYFEPALTDTSPDALAVDAIAAVGPHGHFFGAEHTQSRYTSAFYAPFLSDWRNYEAWAEAGSPHHRAARQPHLEGDPRRIRAAADGRGHPRRARRLRRPPQARGRRAHRLLTRGAARAPLRRNVREETRDMRATLLTAAAVGALAAGAASAQTAPTPVARGTRTRSSSPRRRPRSPTGPRAGPARPRSTPGSRSINGSQEGPDGQPLVELDTSDVLSALDMAFMGSAQFQKDKFGILLDAVYAKLGTDGTWVQEPGQTPRPRPSSASTPPPLSYRVYDDPKGFVDVYGGARYFDTTVEFKIGTANLGQALLQQEPELDRRRSSASAAASRSTTAGRSPASPTTAASTAPTTRAGRSTAAPTTRSPTAGRGRSATATSRSRRRSPTGPSLDIDIQGPLFGITYKF